MTARAAGAALLGLGLLLTGCATSPDRPRPRPTVSITSITDAPRATYPAPPRITLPTSGRLMVFGDSWTFGLKADPVTDGFAYLTAHNLGLQPEIEGVGGTGYLNPGPDNEGTFSQRLAGLPADLAKPSLIIIQGGTNDVGHTTAEVEAAAARCYAQFQARFAGVPIVVVGTGTPDPRLNVFEPIDQGTREAAAAAGLNYISPLAEGWFTIANSARTITDPTDAPHPSNAGHRLFADRLLQDLNAISN